MKERRYFPRARVQVAVNITTQITAMVRKMSEGGIVFATSKPLSRGKNITMLFSIPDGTTIKVRGKVMWSIEILPNHFDNGIDFLFVDGFRKKQLLSMMN